MTTKKLQTITSPAGEVMVVLPKAEYDHLIAIANEAAEDAADAATFAEVMANPESAKRLSPEETAEVLRRGRERR
jgi:hypothetical protein